MGHLRETFPILENLATGAGEVLHTSTPGITPVGRNGLMALAFKDSAGNLVLPQLTSEGKIAVDFEGSGVSVSATSDGEIAGAVTETVIAETALVASKTYGKIHANISCFKETIAYLYIVNDLTETIIGHALVGPGNYNAIIDLKQKEFISGATGTQKLSLRAKNLDKLSDFMGDVAALQFA
jgi:hypothetical protein